MKICQAETPQYLGLSKIWAKRAHPRVPPWEGHIRGRAAGGEDVGRGELGEAEPRGTTIAPCWSPIHDKFMTKFSLSVRVYPHRASLTAVSLGYIVMLGNEGGWFPRVIQMSQCITTVPLPLPLGGGFHASIAMQWESESRFTRICTQTSKTCTHLNNDFILLNVGQ